MSDIVSDMREESTALIAKVIAHLETRGVVPTAVSILNFQQAYNDSEVEIFESVISWLTAEHVVRQTQAPIGDDTDVDVTYYTVVLTSFGFHVLQNSLFDNLTLGQKLQEARDGNRNWSSVGEVIGSTIGGLIKSTYNG